MTAVLLLLAAAAEVAWVMTALTVWAFALSPLLMPEKRQNIFLQLQIIFIVFGTITKSGIRLQRQQQLMPKNIQNMPLGLKLLLSLLAQSGMRLQWQKQFRLPLLINSYHKDWSP